MKRSTIFIVSVVSLSIFPSCGHTSSDASAVSLLRSLFMDISNWLRLHDVWVRFFYVRWRYLPQVIIYLVRTIHYTLLYFLRGFYDSYLIENLPDPTTIMTTSSWIFRMDNFSWWATWFLRELSLLLQASSHFECQIILVFVRSIFPWSSSLRFYTINLNILSCPYNLLPTRHKWYEITELHHMNINCAIAWK